MPLGKRRIKEEDERGGGLRQASFVVTIITGQVPGLSETAGGFMLYCKPQKQHGSGRNNEI